MNHSKVCRWAVCLLVQICFVASASAQQLYYNKVDTLTFGQRFNIRTNTVDWLALTPNVGVEFTLGNKNWSKWTLGVQGRLNWKEQSKETPYHVYDLYDGRVQLRKYWHGKKPTSVFYWGVYAGANNFDIKLNAIGRKGNSLFGGLMFGYVHQLYGYMNGSRLDLDLGLNGGVVFAKFKEYERVLNGNRYEYVITKPENDYKLTFQPLIYAASTDVIRASLIYHFGPKVANKYKKRIMVDNDYRIAQASIKLRRDSVNEANRVALKIRRDSLQELDYEKRFEQQRLENEKRYIQDSLRTVRIAAEQERKKLKLKNKLDSKSSSQGDSVSVTDSVMPALSADTSNVVLTNDTINTSLVSDSTETSVPVDSVGGTTTVDTTKTVAPSNTTDSSAPINNADKVVSPSSAGKIAPEGTNENNSKKKKKRNKKKKSSAAIKDTSLPANTAQPAQLRDSVAAIHPADTIKEVHEVDTIRTIHSGDTVHTTQPIDTLGVDSTIQKNDTAHIALQKVVDNNLLKSSLLYCGTIVDRTDLFIPRLLGFYKKRKYA